MKAIRRVSACLLVLIAPFLMLSGTREAKGPAPQKGYIAYVGTYTTQKTSKGIYAYRFDPVKGTFAPLGLVAKTTDPSFLAVHPNGRFLYAVNEIGNFNGEKSGAVSAFAIDAKSGALKPLNQVSSLGAGPCHISLDQTGKYVLVANYDAGSAAVFAVREDGRLEKNTMFVQHRGSSMNKERQEGPHAHWIATSRDNRFAIVADLGLDEVLVYHFDEGKGSLAPNDPPFARVNPGAGPRHCAFHRDGNFGYVLNELQSTVTAFSYRADSGVLSALQTVSSLPKGFSGPNDAAELVAHPSGKFLYASNRGHDSIAVFSIDADKGALTPVGHVPTKGKTPRNFAIDPTGAYLLAANQNSDNIVIFRIDPASGGLTSAGQVLDVPSPVCIVFVSAE